MDAALARGEDVSRMKPRTRSVRRDHPSCSIVVELVDDRVLMVPPRLVPGSQDVAVEALAGVTVLGTGSVISWDGHDVQIWIQGSMDGIFGTRRSMQAEMAGKADRPRKVA